MDFVPKKIGFFHFGSDERKAPDGLLEKAMEEAGGAPCLRESLIVLPEAFNVGVKYERDPDASPNFSAGVKGRLGEIAAKFECAFVAGLIVDGSGGALVSRISSAMRPRSTAWFISAAGSEQLSEKKGNDGTDFYHPSPVADDVVDSPLSLGTDRTTVSALICMDADVWEDGKASRREALLKKVKKLGASCPILCVPANSRRYSTVEIAESWAKEGFHVVVANGCCLSEAGPMQAGYRPSVIRIKGKAAVPFQAPTNLVMVRPLDA
jgi:predicted amidohydrolase